MYHISNSLFLYLQRAVILSLFLILNKVIIFHLEISFTSEDKYYSVNLTQNTVDIGNNCQACLIVYGTDRL